MAILHNSDLVVVRTGIGGGVGLPNRDVLAKIVCRGGAKTRQRVNELLDAGGDVARARMVHRDRGHRTLRRDCGCGTGTAIEWLHRIADRDGRRHRVVVASIGDINLRNADGRRDNCGAGVVLQQSVHDVHCWRRRIARTRIDDAH